MPQDMNIILPKWYDLHTHLRQDENMAEYIKAHVAMGCEAILAMPNTLPPTAKIDDTDDLPYWSIDSYKNRIIEHGGNIFSTIIVPLYLTKDTTTAMIEKGAKSGLLKAAKYYPPHGTTNADHAQPLENYIKNGVLKTMEDNDIILCVHGEAHDLQGADYFDQKNNAEQTFYETILPRVLKAFPRLKIVCEHITTQTAVDFVKNAPETVAGSVTPQHMLYTTGDLLQGFKYHLYCLPLVKFEKDRQAIRNAVTDNNNTKFFAGTDSAPHTTKATECGCAAGCYTAGYAPQLYARAFEEAGSCPSTIAFKQFLCLNGPAFYNLPVPDKTFHLIKEKQTIKQTGQVTPLPLGIGLETLDWSIRL